MAVRLPNARPDSSVVSRCHVPHLQPPSTKRNASLKRTPSRGPRHRSAPKPGKTTIPRALHPLPNLRPRHLDRREAITKIQKHPPGTFGPLVRPRDINHTPAITYTDHAYLRGPTHTFRPARSAPGHNFQACYHLQPPRTPQRAERPRITKNPERPRPRSDSLARSRVGHRVSRGVRRFGPGPNRPGSLRDAFFPAGRLPTPNRLTPPHSPRAQDLSRRPIRHRPSPPPETKRVLEVPTVHSNTHQHDVLSEPPITTSASDSPKTPRTAVPSLRRVPKIRHRTPLPQLPPLTTGSPQSPEPANIHELKIPPRPPDTAVRPDIDTMPSTSVPSVP